MRTVTCPDCGAQVEIPTVHVGDDSVLVQCKNCLWDDLDSLSGKRGLVVWGGAGLEEVACWTCVPPGGGTLQAAYNALGANGGNLMLQPGTYSGDFATNTGVIGNVHIFGSGMGVTFISGTVAIDTSNVVMQDLTILGTGKSYACKLYKSNAGESRCEFRKVWFGATSASSGDGPTSHGLYLDGAILTVCDHCVFAFNGGSGVFIDTSSQSPPDSTVWSTNVNSFRDCTLSSNARYGIECIQGAVTNGIMLPKIEGGNIESNTLGGCYFQECTFPILRGIDFENSVDVTNWVYMVNCQPALIEDCNFVIGSGKTATRMFLMEGCAAGVVQRCRPSGAGTWTAGAIGVFNEHCVQCHDQDNFLAAAGSGRYINNRGQQRGASS